MSIRSWVVKQLKDSGRTVQAVGDCGVRVVRAGRPDATGYCVEPDSLPFTVLMLEEALGNLPEVGMVIVTRRPVDPDVHSRALELGVCVDTFGGFNRAITFLDDISDYVHPEESYFRKRMFSTRAVISVSRRGHRAWELQRTNGLRSLTVVTHDRYELTDEGFSGILDEYPSLDIDALVITNPSAQGFGKRVVTSAREANVPLYRLDDFASRVRDRWT
ncbi:hypothetical protein ABZ383_13375 [Streptomyces sp. NPDC005900]|uniref:hypothetical protein n=1 Tax=Streptomyces sp. NPDC005900 TaxID=3154569 RepID=UPI0034113EAE